MSEAGGLANKIKSEIVLAQRLENLNVQASSLTKASSTLFCANAAKSSSSGKRLEQR